MIEIEGTANLERMLVELGAKAETRIPAALFQAAETVMARSKPNVPVDTGVLRGSGHVSLPSRSATGWEVMFGYGGAAQKYAYIQHEADDFNHPKGGQSHYLSEPVEEFAPGLEAFLVARLGLV